MIRAGNASLSRSKRPKREPGRHIFAYCNVTTNQVLYSLTQVLQGNSSLKQLPDAGANNNPPKLRKDLWRPLWSVTLPDGKDGLAQGLHAFKKLGEWRQLHELSWTPPPELARPTTQEEMDAIQSKLDERGGSKTDTVYDIIKKKKKKLRQRMVMDQKANSIADLAAVLIEQDAKGAKTADVQQTMQKQERDEEVAEMLKLAQKVREGGVPKIDAELEALQARIQAKKEGNSDEDASNRSMTKQIHALEKQRRRMQFCANAVWAADMGTTWLQNDDMTAKAADEAFRQQLRSLRQQIQDRRDGKTVAVSELTGAEEQPIDEGTLAPEEAMMGAQAVTPDSESLDTISKLSGANRADRFQHKAVMLELEMIRRKHENPKRVAKALQAYNAKQADIDSLQEQAQQWKFMFSRLLGRYQRNLAYWQELQTAVDAGESEVARLTAERSSGTETRELDFAAFQKRTPFRMSRIRSLENDIPFLESLVQLTSETRSVEETEAKIREYQSSHPGQNPSFPLKVSERGLRSQLKVMDPGRAFATVLAKAKVEERAAKLAQELESAVATGNLAEEPAERDESELGMEELEGVDADAEQLAEPTQEELREAVKQVRRSSARVHDVDNIAAYGTALEQDLKEGEPWVKLHELKSGWCDLSKQEKGEHIAELKRQRPALQRARHLLAQPDGLERVVQAAEAARERSLAARETNEQQVILLQKSAAKIFETVANLRTYEDVLLRAPESAFEEPVVEEVEQEVAPTASESEVVVGEAQEAGASQESEPNSQDDSQADTPLDTNQAAEKQRASARKKVDYHALLPSFPEKTTLPKKGRVRQKLLTLRRPIHTAKGVTVKWNNMLDAEYAEAWPEDVVHEPMGLSRHTAPRVGDEPVFDVAEWKNLGGGYKGKKFAREVERKTVRERVRGVTERVLEAVGRREGERRALEKGNTRRGKGMRGARDAGVAAEIGSDDDGRSAELNTVDEVGERRSGEGEDGAERRV